MLTWTQGVKPNGDIDDDGVATIDVFNCRRGRFRIVAVGRDNAKLTLTQDGAAVTSTELWPHGVWEHTLETGDGAGRCTVSLATTSLVHLSEFNWRPR